MDLTSIEFLLTKLSSFSEDGVFHDRLFLQQQSMTLFGEGFGRYGAISETFGMPSIPDGEYMKIIAEQGYIGLTIIILMFSIAIIKSFRFFKYLYFEFSLLIMLLLCMVGADPLSIFDKHCFLFWLALGQISNYQVQSHSTVTTE